MKVVGKYIKHLFNQKHHAELTFLISNYRHTQMLNELDDSKEYRIEISEIKSKRSLEQNKLMWELLHRLEIKTRETAMSWYIKALVDTGAKFDYIWATEKTEDSLKKQFRAVERVKPYKIKDSEGWLYRVVVGSSKFNVSEMNELLDTVIRYCNNWDIQVEEYEI